ncbi:MAG: hypothetical protein AB4206_10195 [Xenococcaceae cyanobacterium]
MKKLFLHIGLHKTGSTTLQTFLLQNKKVLSDFGYLYPKIGIPPTLMGHHNLAWLLNNDKRADSNFGNWQQLHEEIKDSNFNKIIISSEDFESANRRFIHDLKSNLESYEVKVIVYIRRQDRQIESQYTQHTKDGIFSGDLLSFCEKMRNNSDFYRLLESWKQEFGNDNLIVRPLEKEQIPNICHDFLRHININEIDYFTNVKNQNTKPGRKTIEILKLVNRIYENKPQERKKAYLRKIVNFTAKYWSDQRNYRLLSYSDASKIMKWYEQSNQAIAREYLGRENGILFYEQLEPYENEAFDLEDLSIEELLSLILAIVEVS